MRLKRSSKRGILIIGMIVLALFAASDTCASPLYGGYNGESETWVEFFIEANTIGFSLRASVGVDPSATWIRIGISSLFLLPYFSNLEFSYETGDVSSLSITFLLPIKIGADTNGLEWGIVNWAVIVFGADSEGGEWQEWLSSEAWFPVFEGEDSNNNQWQWIRLFPVLVGWREDLTSQQGVSLNQKNSLRLEEEFRSLHNHFTRTGSPKLSALLIEKLTDDAVMEGMIDHLEALNARMALPLTVLSLYENREGFFPRDPSSGISSELNTLLTYVDEEIFTEEIRDELNVFLDTFARDIQPRLKTIKKIVTAP